MKNFIVNFKKYNQKISKAILFAFIFNLTSIAVSRAADQEVSSEKKVSGVYHDLSMLHLPSLASLKAKEKSVAKKVKKENQEAQKEKKIKNIKLPNLGEVEKLKFIYNFFAQRYNDDSQKKLLLSKNVFHDLEVFSGGKHDLESHLFSKILDNTETSMGKVQLQKMFYEATDDVLLLKKRQKIIKALIADEQLCNELDQQLKNIKEAESDFFWFWKDLDEGVDKLLDIVYFKIKFLQSLNKDQVMMEVLSLWTTVVSPLSQGFPLLLAVYLGWYMAPLAKPYSSIVVEKLKEDPVILLPIVIYIFLYCYSSYLVMQNAITYNTVANLIQQKMINVGTVVNSISSIAKTLKMDEFISCNMPNINNIYGNFVEQGVVNFLNDMNSGSFKGKPSFWSNRGKILTSFKNMFDLKENFFAGLKLIGDIDAYLSVAKLYKKYENHSNARFCFVDYLDQDLPYINIKDYWHPILNPEKVVTNDIELGGQGNPNNIVLTGPNAAGKSTNLKSIAISLALAQSFGIAPASRMRFTPFSYIDTYLNIADSTGKESQFQAEMYRAKSLIDKVRVLNAKGKKSFVIIDEVFTGTNPKEAMAGAYGVAKRLSTYDTSMAIFATHFMVMTDLEKDTDGKFENYKVYVTKDENGKICYPYKLEKGITDQAIALDLLNEEGFGDDILQDAQDVIANKINERL